MKRDPRDQKVVRYAGLFYVCFELSLRGWEVLSVSYKEQKNEIVCRSEDGQEVSILTAGRSIKTDYALPKDQKIKADFLIIVTDIKSCKPITYILRHDELEPEGIDKNADGRSWLRHKWYMVDRFKERWERIGSGFIGS